MPELEDIPYLQRRVSRERERAYHSNDISARTAHLKLADRYFEKLEAARTARGKNG